MAEQIAELAERTATMHERTEQHSKVIDSLDSRLGSLTKCVQDIAISVAKAEGVLSFLKWAVPISITLGIALAKFIH